MSNEIIRMMELVFSAGPRHDYCRRPACRRAGYCVPPRDRTRQNFWACPFEPFEIWYQRGEAAAKLTERLSHLIDTKRARKGKPPLFAPPPQPGPADHLDLSKPLDWETLRPKPDPSAPFPSGWVCR